MVKKQTILPCLLKRKLKEPKGKEKKNGLVDEYAPFRNMTVV